jgi:hypothetical protein
VLQAVLLTDSLAGVHVGLQQTHRQPLDVCEPPDTVFGFAKLRCPVVQEGLDAYRKNITIFVIHFNRSCESVQCADRSPQLPIWRKYL